MIFGLRERLLEAVEIRLRADVPIGVYLSGGIDSAVIAGMAAHVAKEQGWKHLPNCYTIGFDEGTEFDETGKYCSFPSCSSCSLSSSSSSFHPLKHQNRHGHPPPSSTFPNPHTTQAIASPS